MSILNSVIITAGAIFGLVLLGSVAAYVIARRTRRWTTFTYYLVLIAIILPAQLGTVPLYIGARSVGLTGNAIGMILLWIGILLPLSVFLYASFFRGLSTEYEEAAVIDGAIPDAGVLPRRAAADGARDRNRRDPRRPDRLERLLQLADLPRRIHHPDPAGRDVHLRRRAASRPGTRSSRS